MQGWIKLHRGIQEHWIYKEERVFSRYEAWLDVLMRVNHAENKVTHNGTLETVQRGSAIWSIGDMEKHWGWSNRKVKRFLDCLVADQMLTYKSTTKKTYLTVVNYDKYQGSDIEKAPPKHHQSISEAFQKHTNKNEKNLENEKNDKNLYIGLPTDDVRFLQIYDYYFDQTFNTAHMQVTEERLDFIIRNIEELECYGIEENDFIEAVEQHFQNLPENNNGNILAFIPAFKRYFDVQPVD